MCAHSSSSSSSRNLFDSFWLPLYALASPFLERGAIVCARPSCWAEWRHHHRERKKPVASGPKHKWISRVIKDARLLFSCNYIVGIDFIYTYHFIPISPVNPSLYISIDSLFYFHKHKLQHLQASVCWPERRVPVAWWAPLYVDLAMSNGCASAEQCIYNTFTSCLIYRVISTTEFLIAPSLHERAYIYPYLLYVRSTTPLSKWLLYTRELYSKRDVCRAFIKT